MNAVPRRALLLAALAAVRVKARAPELAIVPAWLDSWSGLGLVVVRMQRHGYDVTLTQDRNGWRATFLHRRHVLYPWVGQVLHWWPTPWRAVQEAAWRALSTPFNAGVRGSCPCSSCFRVLWEQNGSGEEALNSAGTA